MSVKNYFSQIIPSISFSIVFLGKSSAPIYGQFFVRKKESDQEMEKSPQSLVHKMGLVWEMSLGH